jgi:4-diphosphocytidyl-2-C-methyl-D-erythritol kinase
MAEVTVRAFAKINLTLEVLNKRSDGFHNLRTVFQTISLHDTIRIAAENTGETQIHLESNIEIPGENLAVRAARGVLDAIGATASVAIKLQKKIPMGGGLGGGSTDAAAVLLTLPEVFGLRLPFDKQLELASSLGSVVPFFLIGGTAVGVGRGTELYPISDAKCRFGLLLAPLVHVSTAQAYAGLNRTEGMPGSDLGSTPKLAFLLAAGEDWSAACVNDFESTVFLLHPELGALRARLSDLGGSVARMSGSGASIFGLFSSESARQSAIAELSNRVRCIPFEFVSGAEYRNNFFRLPSSERTAL